MTRNNFEQDLSAENPALPQRNMRETPRDEAVKPKFWQGLGDLSLLRVFSVKTPRNLVILPPDPWTGNISIGRDIVGDQFRFYGQRFSTRMDGWKPDRACPDFIAHLHGFEWLRDLRALGGDQARRAARILVKDWLVNFKRWDSVVWRPDIVGTRLASWIGLHDFFLSSADDVYRQAIFQSIQKQSSYLLRVLPGHIKGARLIAALKGQIFACLALPNNQSRLFQALSLLDVEIERQILPDGGHIERCPQTHATVLRHFIDIRAALRCAGLAVPESLINAIHQMAPILRFYCYGDGKLAQFNGSGEGDSALLNMIAQQAHAGGKIATDAPHIGYERLQLGRSVVMFDVGTAPAAGYDTTYHAGPLAFEFSHARERMVINCGHAGSMYRDLPFTIALRQTAAHSTATIADTNAVELRSEGGIGRHPKTIHLHHEHTKDHVIVAASHDGYHSNLGVIHTRQLYLGDNGEDLRGQDSFVGSAGHPFAVRFHLSPDVKASLTGNNAGVLLRTRSGAGWRFRCSGAVIALEDSISMPQPGDAPKKTTQIVLSGHTADKEVALKWSFKREKKPRTTGAEKDADDTSAAPAEKSRSKTIAAKKQSATSLIPSPQDG